MSTVSAATECNSASCGAAAIPYLCYSALACAALPVNVRHHGTGANDDRLSALGREVASGEVGL